MTDDDIHDLFRGLGTVSIRRMFGGKGVYHEGMIVAVEVDGELLLKADAVTAPEFVEAGSTQWAYDGKKRPVAMPYWSIPDAAFDDPEEMAHWTRLAFEAARRSRK